MDEYEAKMSIAISESHPGFSHARRKSDGLDVRLEAL